MYASQITLIITHILSPIGLQLVTIIIGHLIFVTTQNKKFMDLHSLQLTTIDAHCIPGKTHFKLNLSVLFKEAVSSQTEIKSCPMDLTNYNLSAQTTIKHHSCVLPLL
jgi:hypothetical protein